GTTVERHYPEDLGGAGVQSKLRQHKNLSGLHHIVETPALVKKIIEAERSGFDAVVQSNTFDAGVEAARLAVRIPVVGLLRSSCHFAACLCDRFAVIVPLESHVNYVSRITETYRLGHWISAIRAINMYESELSSIHDLIVERTISLGRELVAEGAQAIIPLGGRIIPYEVTPEELEPEIGVPIIHTTAVGIRFAELMASSKVTHSQKAYPWSPGLNPEDISHRSIPR
ncbi:aspartate/glutamate racemase family protein, partial [Thermodesulfobacteriota bacterium]